jgi:hypothetical protein
VREALQGEDDRALGLVLSPAPRTLREVRLERGNAKPLLAIEEQVELFRE